MSSPRRSRMGGDPRIASATAPSTFPGPNRKNAPMPTPTRTRTAVAVYVMGSTSSSERASVDSVRERDVSKRRLAHHEGVSIRVLRGLLAGLVALVVGLMGVRILLPTNADAALDCSQIARQSAARNHVDDGTGSRRIVVLGDSYAQG